MNFVRRHPFVFAAAVLAALLLAVIGWETQWGTRIRPALPVVPPKPGAAVDARVLPTLAAAAPEQAYPESVARPLFVPSRRPAPTAPTTPVATMPKGTLTLQGVTIAGNTRIAMLREKSGRVHRVEQGRTVNGMTVASVEPERVVLTMGDEQETVAMLVSRAGGAPGTPPAAPAPASGPFPPPPATPAPPAPGGPPPVGTPPMPGQPMPGQPGGAPVRAADGTPLPGAPVAGAQPPQPNATPMTPEELLARRRARRNPQ